MATKRKTIQQFSGGDIFVYYEKKINKNDLIFCFYFNYLIDEH